jgi:hypothetical protein
MGLDRMGAWRFGIRCYVLAILGPTLGDAAACHRGVGHGAANGDCREWPRFFTLILPSLAFAFVPSNFHEEIGWTRFLLDRMQDHYRPRV